METLVGKDIFTPVFTAALFLIAKTWKQTKCPLTDKWIKKMWYIYTVKYYTVIKKENFAICNNMNGLKGYYA